MSSDTRGTAERKASGKIYVIGHREVESHIGPMGVQEGLKMPIDYYKIGIACNPERRLSNLQIGTPHELELVTTLETSNPEAVESLLHSIYHCSKKSGEWFKLTHNDVNSLTALNQLEVSDLEVLNDGVVPSWLNKDTNLYLEVERVRRGDAE